MKSFLRDVIGETYRVPAGERLDMPLSGNFATCLSATGRLEIGFNNGGRAPFETGLGRETDNGEEFISLQLYNDTGSDIDVEMVWGYGGFKDQRLSASGNLNVVNPSGQKLDVDDADTQTALADILTMMQNDKDQRASLTTLEGATNAFVRNANTTIVASGANTDGIIIRFFQVSAWGNSGADVPRIKLDGLDLNYFVKDGQITGGDIFVPAGVELSANSSTSTCSILIWYEVL